MAGVLLLICVSSLNYVPSHAPRRGPIDRCGFQEPLPRTLGRKGDALGLAGLDRERVEPEWLPAVVKTIEQPEVMTVQVKHGCGGGAIAQREHDDASGFHRENLRGLRDIS